MIIFNNEIKLLPIEHNEDPKSVHTPTLGQMHIETDQEITNPGESHD
ncbi:hypothetical protein MHB57_28905 [Bacillus sp. FSL L8-0315]